MTRSPRLLESVRYEVIPTPDVESGVDALPPGSTVTVTCHGDRGLDRTIDAAVALRERGFEAVPHVAARLVPDESYVVRLLDRLSDAGIEEVFVIGGDAKTPSGRYAGAHALIADLHRHGEGRLRVGVAGYPEGHPLIEEAVLMSELRRKQELSHYVVTQLCFDPGAVERWIERIRGAGIELPVVLGVPGPVGRARLLRIARAVGVGSSLRFLRKNVGVARFLARSDTSATEALITRFEREGSRRSAVAGLHLFTFNEIEPAEQWRRELLAAALASG